MIYVLIIGLILSVGAGIWMFRENERLAAKGKVWAEIHKERAAKVGFMLRELNEVYKKQPNKHKTFLCGILETLEWVGGKRKDEQFTGWMWAKQHVNRKERKK